MTLFAQNAGILSDIAAGGCDLSQPRPVDFSHLFKDEASARAFAEAAEKRGFKIGTTEIYNEDNMWDVTVSTVMIPSCESITSTEADLDILARCFDGYADGWGFWEE